MAPKCISLYLLNNLHNNHAMGVINPSSKSWKLRLRESGSVFAQDTQLVNGRKQPRPQNLGSGVTLLTVAPTVGEGT